MTENEEYYRKMQKQYRKKRAISYAIIFGSIFLTYGIAMAIIFSTHGSPQKSYGDYLSYESFKSRFDTSFNSLDILEANDNDSIKIVEQEKSKLKIVVRADTGHLFQKYMTYKDNSNSKDKKIYDFSNAIYGLNANESLTHRVTGKGVNLYSYASGKSHHKKQISEVEDKTSKVDVNLIDKTYQVGSEITKDEYRDYLKEEYKLSASMKLNYLSYITSENKDDISKYSFYIKNDILTITESQEDYSSDTGAGFPISFNLYKAYRFYLNSDNPKVETIITASGSRSLDKDGKSGGDTYYNVEYNYSYKKTYKIKKVNRTLKEQKLNNFTLID